MNGLDGVSSLVVDIKKFQKLNKEAEDLKAKQLLECEESIRNLEGIIKTKDAENQKLLREYQALTKAYSALQADFTYNYQLFQERDAEISSFEKLNNELREQLAKSKNEKEILLKEKARLEGEIKKEVNRNNEIELYYQEQLQEKSREQEQLKQAMEAEKMSTINEFEATIRDLSREHSERIKLLDQQRGALEGDLKDMLAEKDETIKKLLQQIREKELMSNKYLAENESIKRTFAAKIKVLEDEKQALDNSITEMMIQHRTEMEELQKQHTKQHQQLIASYEPTLARLKSDIDECQTVIKNQKESLKICQRQIEDHEKQRLFDINSLRNEYEEKLRKKDKDIEVMKDKEWEYTQKLESKEDMINSLKKMLDERKQEAESLKDEVKSLTERENNTKREMLRMSLQLEHEKEQKDKEINEKHDQMLKMLKKERDDATAILEDKDRQIDELRREIMVLNTELSLAASMKKAPYDKLKPQNKSSSKYQQLINEIDDELSLGSIDMVSSPSSFSSKMENKEAPVDVPKVNASVDLLTVSNMHMEQITTLNSLVTELRLDLESQKEKLYRSEEKLISMSLENKQLRAKLKEAVHDLKTLCKEKEKLTDMSNALKKEVISLKERNFMIENTLTPLNVALTTEVNNNSNNTNGTRDIGVNGKSKPLSSRKKKH
nr:unnamed protein product [Naegleria fowleri]